MSEYIIEIPDEYFPSYDMERTAYYPDERDSAMPLTSFVRCRDCKHYHAEINGCDEFGDIWHDEYANVEPDGFCAWGERRPE